MKLKEVFSVLVQLAIISSFLLELRKYRTKVKLARSRDLKKRLDTSAKATTISAIKERDIVELIFGMGAILLSLGNFSLLEFGPSNTAALTVGSASSIAVSLILAFCGFLVLRG